MERPTFLDLPNEILVGILANLSLKDLLICRQACHRLQSLHDESSQLQYLVELETAGMIDNPYCTMSIADRLAALRRKEAAWAALEVPGFQVSIPVPKTPSGVYDVTPTVYLLGVAASAHLPFTLGIQSLRFGSAPGGEEEPPTFMEVRMSKQIVDFGTSVEEHDLLAIVTIAATNENRFYLEVTLLRHSTGELHDKAQVPVLTVTEIFNMPSISIEISGQNLALSVAEANTAPCALYIFDWQKGRPKGPVYPVSNLGLVFLREDLLLIPNIHDPSFSIHHVPYSRSTGAWQELTIQRLTTLALPALDAGHRILNLQIRCDPSPTGGGVYPRYGPRGRPFANDPRAAVMIMEMALHDLAGGTVKTFVMFVKREALVRALPEGWERRVAVARMVVATATVTPLNRDVARDETSVPMHIPVHVEIVAPALQVNAVPLVPWEEWGPRVTRWLDGDQYNSLYITSTAGQRFVSIESGARTAPKVIKILDFNRYHVRKVELASGEAEHAKDGDPGKVDEVEEPKRTPLGVVLGSETAEGEHLCPTRGAFISETILSKMPCISQETSRKYDFDAVLVDEQRILGIKYDDRNDRHSVESVEALYFG